MEGTWRREGREVVVRIGADGEGEAGRADVDVIEDLFKY